ncbi:hypothetical protein ACAN107058_07640 [Paracidovorax anthurii]
MNGMDTALAAPRKRAWPEAAGGAGRPWVGERPGSPREMVENAVARLRIAWSVGDPDLTADHWIASAEWSFRDLAQALEARRREVGARLAALGAARLHAQGRSLDAVVALARRLPARQLFGRALPSGGVPRLEDLVTTACRAAGLLDYGWQGLSAPAMAAWALGHGTGRIGVAAENPTVAWLGGGAVAPATAEGPSLVMDGAIDVPVLRALRASIEGRLDEALSIARVHSALLQDAAEQVECAAAALDAIDLRVQEVTWVLGRLEARLGPVVHHVRQVLDAREAVRSVPRPPFPGAVPGADGGVAPPAPAGLPAPPTVPEPIARETLEPLALLGAALFRASTVHILDDMGRLTRQSGETVAAMRRLLLTVA